MKLQTAASLALSKGNRIHLPAPLKLITHYQISLAVYDVLEGYSKYTYIYSKCNDKWHDGRQVFFLNCTEEVLEFPPKMKWPLLQKYPT